MITSVSGEFFFDRIEHLDTVNVRHLHIGDNDVIFRLMQFFQGVFAVEGGVNGIAQPHKLAGEQLPDSLIIVRNKYTRFRSSHNIRAAPHIFYIVIIYPTTVKLDECNTY
jgi:hypothetical protein